MNRVKRGVLYCSNPWIPQGTPGREEWWYMGVRQGGELPPGNRIHQGQGWPTLHKLGNHRQIQRSLDAQAMHIMGWCRGEKRCTQITNVQVDKHIMFEKGREVGNPLATGYRPHDLFSNIVCLLTATRYACRIIWVTWHYGHNWFRMMFADGLVPVRHQGICIYHDGVATYQACLTFKWSLVLSVSTRA